MLVHAVYFWLKPDLKAEDRIRFEQRLNGLLKISSLVHGWVGTPAETDRPVIDRTYSFGLLTVFKDMAGHDAYQVDPLHLSFLECKDAWSRVQIYDFK